MDDDGYPREPGEVAILPVKRSDGDGFYCYFGCPRKKGLCAVPLAPLGHPPHNTGWQWDKNHEAPTLTPSIICHGCEWHGYVRAGRLVDA